MKKQIILSLGGLVLLLSLYLLGKTTSDQKPIANNAPISIKKFDIQSFISSKRNNINPELLNKIASNEQILQAKDVLIPEKINAFNTLATIYKDSLNLQEPYLYYTSSAAKLDNSEKNLTFAAQLFLTSLRSEQDQSKVEWESGEAIALFEKAITINPDNDDLKIGLASCFIFGKGRSGDPQQTMKGILELLAVVRKDSTNMKAQMLLGIGGYVSGQYDKAISRLSKVIENQPGNLEAMAFLADTYAAKGDKAEAIKWYQISKRLANDEHYTKEVDNRIKELQR